MLARHTSDRLMMPCFWGQASGRPAGLQWPTATRVMFGGMACLVETDVEAALVHGHFQLLFVILGPVWLQDFFQKSLSHQKESYYFIVLNKICL